MENTGWSYNGLNFGFGTNFLIKSKNGFDDVPTVRKADLIKADAHGAFMGIDLLDERTISVVLALVGAVGTTPQAVRASYQSLVTQVKAAFVPQQSLELPFIYDAASRLINCRVSKLVTPPKQAFQGGYGEATIELIASDPRIYDANLTSESTGLATASGGVHFPVVFPANWGTVGAGGTISCVNNGFFPTAPIFSISGPVQNPAIDDLTTGQSMVLNITLNTGDTLVLDAGAKTILLNPVTVGGVTTGANRYNVLQPGSAWFLFPSGTTQVRYRNNGAVTGSQLTVQFRSAWL